MASISASELIRLSTRKQKRLRICVKVKKNQYITHKFDVIDCKRKSREPCKYKSLALKGKKKKVKCENGLPVHLEQGIYDNFDYDSEN